MKSEERINIINKSYYAISLGIKKGKSMKDRGALHLKFILAVLLITMMSIFLGGCSKKSDTAQHENETEFLAYYESLKTDNIETEGNVYYASSQVLLTSVSDADYEDIEKLIKGNNGEIIGYISSTGDYQIRFNNSLSFEELEQLVENLKKDELIEDASLDYVAQIGSEEIDYTNDPWIDVNNPSDTSGSVWDEDNPEGKNWWAEAINMPAVWDKDLSTQTVKIGIIDTMFDITNEDLDENLFAQTWNNPVNDEGTCRVTQLYNDAVAAYEQALTNGNQNVINNLSESIGNASHGTHVAGIIAAQADNGFGIAGINQNSKLYGYSMRSEESAESDEAQWGSIFEFKCAIAHLLNEGVKVINISMGFNEALVGTQDGNSSWSTFTSVNSKALESFLLKYIEAGNEFLIVKAAGNNSTSDKKYDAGNDIFGAISNEQVAQRIIIVGAAGYDTKYDYYSVADFSNTGSRVDVYAPGVDVLSDIPSNVTSLMSGTSVAAPVVTGLASLIWGINSDLSAEQVRSIILASSSANVFDLDNESWVVRNFLNWTDNPTAIVNADICVQLAQDTIGRGKESNAEYGIVSGMVYGITSDESAFVDINIDSLSLYDKNRKFISNVPLQGIAYDIIDNDTGEASVSVLHTYSVLLEPGEYIFEAKADGYESQEQQVSVDANGVIKADLKFVNMNNLVTDAYTDAMVDGGYCYHIPQINLSGNRGGSFNTKIYDEFYSLLTNDVYQSIKEINYPNLSNMVYAWGEKNNLVSIIIQTNATMYDQTDFYVYTVSAETGEEVSTGNVTQSYGLTEEDFYNLVKTTMLKYWDGQETNLVPNIGEELFQSLVSQTLTDDNVKTAIPYINKNGELCVVVNVYSPAGAGKYPHLLNTSSGADEGRIECTVDHFTEETESAEPPVTEHVESSTEVETESISEQELLGEWVIDTEYTMDFNDMSMWDFYGTSFKGGNKMTFSSDGSYEYYVAWCYGKGSFELQNGEISVELMDGDPIQGSMKLLAVTDGVTRIALDQYNDGKLVFWIKQ